MFCHDRWCARSLSPSLATPSATMPAPLSVLVLPQGVCGKAGGVWGFCQNVCVVFCCFVQLMFCPVSPNSE